MEPAGRADSAPQEQSSMVLCDSNVRRACAARRRRCCEQSEIHAGCNRLRELPSRTSASGTTCERLLSNSCLIAARCRQTRLARQTGHQGNEDRLELDEPKTDRVDELLVSEHQGQGRTVTALTLEALTKTFPRAGTVVDSIDLHIEPGEF